MKKKSPYIIAEIGNNHEGNIDNAKKLIHEAKKTGADAVKFQTFKLDDFVSQDYPSYEKLKKFQLSFIDFKKLKEYADSIKIDFISTPLDLKSAEYLCKLCKIIKIASGDNNFYDLIYFLAKKKKKIIISTGLIDFSEIQRIINFILKNFGKNYLQSNVTLLHCITSYPVKDEFANLDAIRFLKDKLKKYKFHIGYSDHTVGSLAPIVATSLGASVIEKHFTLDNNFSSFRDHKISLNPVDMRNMIIEIRRIKKLLGDYNKKIQSVEKKILRLARRTLFAKKDIKKNEILSFNNLSFLRSNNSKKTDLRKLFNLKKSKKFYKKGSKIN